MEVFISDKISVLHRISTGNLDKRLSGLGINRSQASFIISVCEKKGQPQESIARCFHIDKGAAARTIKELEDKGYIKRICCRDDNRRRCVFPTEKALSVYDELKKCMAEWDNTVTAGFTDLEKIILENLLDRLAENALSAKNNK